MDYRILTSALTMFLLSACGGGASEVKVFKYDESVSCDESSGIPLATMQQELTNAGIDVLCAQKGNDGRPITLECGTKFTGKINIYLIRRANLVDAENLGFKNTDDLESYEDERCEES